MDGFDHLKPPMVEGVFAGEVGACTNLCGVSVLQGTKRKQSDCEVGIESIFHTGRPKIEGAELKYGYLGLVPCAGNHWLLSLGSFIVFI